MYIGIITNAIENIVLSFFTDWRNYVDDLFRAFYFIKDKPYCRYALFSKNISGEFMSKQMLIDARHPEEVRVAVVDGGKLVEMDVDTSTKKQIKGNIYLAKVIRVEPSLQAAFVDYGGHRHGFLPFSGIHPDYYQIPVADKEALKQLINQEDKDSDDMEDDVALEGDVEVVSAPASDDVHIPKTSFFKKYKIQEVIHHGQVMLVQVIKEERGNKGAALTTYLSLAGRYSVLMPNNGRGAGISRKITNVKERKNLKEIVSKLPIPEGMSVIIRTAGQEKKKTDIRRDYDYLIKTWMKIREQTLSSIAPKLIHEEGDIIKRSLRDVFTADIEDVFVEGGDTFKSVKDFVKLLLPSQAKKVTQYRGDIPLFSKYQIESQIEVLYNNVAQLKSGGYLVIDQTEAMVTVDVNSGRAIRERDLEETALKTNLEACEELARQLRLRDLAGLVVIDFIDMMEPKNNAHIERALREALRHDRARIQMGKISGFGLMEMSRQRLHSSVLESSYVPCPCCAGKGRVRTVESCAIRMIHLLEGFGTELINKNVIVFVPEKVALYLLNNTRSSLTELEEKGKFSLRIMIDPDMQVLTDYRLEKTEREDPLPVEEKPTSTLRKIFQKKSTPEKNETVKEEKVEQAKEEKDTKENNKQNTRGKKSFKSKKEKGNGGTEEKAAEEKFKVVSQESLVLFDAKRRQEPDTPKKRTSGKTKEKSSKEQESQAEKAPEPSPKGKKGWWNKLMP